MSFNETLRQKTQNAERIVMRFLPKQEGLQKTVIEAMNYGMTAGGKRLRPLLMLETFELFGGKSSVIEPFMAAIEMIHNYSLIHDDLPALDNDEYRRGRKTTHAVFGETMGILAGDALLNYAYETAVTAFDIEISERTTKAIKVLAKKAGIYGMVGGQVVDVESEGRSAPIETVKFIHTNKTGAMIESAMLIGAILAGATDREQDIIYKVAADIGLAFQIQDDILDETGTLETIGKPAGSDSKNKKSTYVTLLGIDKAKNEVRTLTDRAIDNLRSLPYSSGFLEELLISLINRAY